MVYDSGKIIFWAKAGKEMAHIKLGLGGLELTIREFHFLEPCVVAEGLAFREECLAAERRERTIP
jgi:hypothetical protein